MANAEKLESVLGVIRANPEKHSQRSWASQRPGCGTTMCFAGWTVYLEGAEMVFELTADQTITNTCRLPNGDKRMISEYAMQILDLNEAEADHIFMCMGDLDKVALAVKDVINGDIPFSED